MKAPPTRAELLRNNTVNYYGGTVSQNIISGYSQSGQANNNTVNLYSGMLSLFGNLYGRYSESGSEGSGNTLNVYTKREQYRKPGPFPELELLRAERNDSRRDHAHRHWPGGCLRSCHHGRSIRNRKPLSRAKPSASSIAITISPQRTPPTASSGTTISPMKLHFLYHGYRKTGQQ